MKRVESIATRTTWTYRPERELAAPSPERLVELAIEDGDLVPSTPDQLEILAGAYAAAVRSLGEISRPHSD